MEANEIVQYILTEIGYFNYIESKKELTTKNKNKMNGFISICGELNNNTYTNVIKSEFQENAFGVYDPVFIGMCNEFRCIYSSMNLKTSFQPNNIIQYSFI
jgi:hypothetical protein